MREFVSEPDSADNWAIDKDKANYPSGTVLDFHAQERLSRFFYLRPAYWKQDELEKGQDEVAQNNHLCPKDNSSRELGWIRMSMHVEVARVEIVMMHIFLMRVGNIMTCKFLIILFSVEVIPNPIQGRVKFFRWCPRISLAGNTPVVASTAKNLDWDSVVDLHFTQIILR